MFRSTVAPIKVKGILFGFSNYPSYPAKEEMPARPAERDMDSPAKAAIEPVRRKSMALMPILDLYILREFLMPLFALILGFIVLFLIGNIFEDLKDLLEGKAKIAVMVEFFLLKLPGNIRFILPISVMLACMYMLASFAKNHEIIAMRASGISLQRCCVSVYIVAFMVTLVNFWFNEALVPGSEKKAVNILKKLRYQNDGVQFNENEVRLLTYRSPDRKSTWFFKYFDMDGVHKDVILKKYRDNGSLLWYIEAEEGEFFPDKGWHFRNGTKVSYNEDGFLPAAPEKFAEKALDRKEFPETPSDIRKTAMSPEDLSSLEILDIIMKTRNMAKACENIYLTTLYSRMAFPWTCIIAVFLAVPLAVRHERSGIFIAIVTSVGIMVAYQMLSHIFCIMGNRGYMNPAVAGLAPTLVFIFYGVWNVRKCN